MAEPELIRVLMMECSTLVVRKLQPEELEAAHRVWVRHLEPYSGELLGEAVDAWIMNQSDDRPPFKLPSAKQIMRIAADMSKPDAPASEERWANFVPPRPEVVRAHVAAQRKISTLYGGVLKNLDSAEHDHRSQRVPIRDERGEPLLDEEGRVVHDIVSGPEVCRVCGPAGDARREKVDEILDALPEPQASGARSCKCDGSGWIEVQDPMSADVYPCSTCNPYFWEWRGIDRAEAS